MQRNTFINNIYTIEKEKKKKKNEEEKKEMKKKNEEIKNWRIKKEKMYFKKYKRRHFSMKIRLWPYYIGLSQFEIV